MAQDRVPMILCGKIPSHIKAVTAAVESEFEVLRICSSVEAAEQAVQDYFVHAVSTPKPLVFVMGGGFLQDDFEQVVAISPSVQPHEADCQIAWFRPAHFAPGANQEPVIAGGPPPAEVIARRAHDALWTQLETLRSGAGKGKVYYF